MKRIIFAFTIIIGLYCQQNAIGQQTPIVQKAKYFRKTPPLRDMKKIMPGQRDRSWKDWKMEEWNNVRLARWTGNNGGNHLISPPPFHHSNIPIFQYSNFQK